MTNHFTNTDGFVGYSPEFRDELFFHGKDSEVNFEANKKKLGDSWYYTNNQITYKRNSLGHRSGEIQDLNLDNYIICTGCSLTEGIGVEVENRYSNLLQKDLNVDVYNMGVASSGNDVIVLNLLTWLARVEKKPKFIVIQWTDIHRFMTDDVQLKGLWLNTEPAIEQFFGSGDEINYFLSKSKYLRGLLKTVVNTPIIEIPWSSKFPNTGSQADTILPKTNYSDYGRDFMHPGIVTHRRWADMIVEKAKHF
jgi:hypothetical protein